MDYSEILADANNRTWRGRTMLPTRLWNESLTYYDADGQVLSRNNTTPRPIPKYHLNVCGTMDRLEDLIWLISENKDQSILLLHQFRQGKIEVLDSKRLNFLF